MIVKVKRVDAGKTAKGSVILLHGLGGSSESWRGVEEGLSGSELNYVFPDSNVKPVTAVPHTYKSMWFDVVGVDGPLADHDTGMFWESVACVLGLIEEEVRRGVPSERIVVGGFSQGGSIALGVAIACKRQLAGIVSFRGFLTIDGVDQHLAGANLATSVLHLHSLGDPMIHGGYAKATEGNLARLGFTNYELHESDSQRHVIEDGEMACAIQFIKRVLEV